MEINHNPASHKVWCVKDGHKAQVEYTIKGQTLDVEHTYVPTALEGQGIASQLVQYAYDYARQQGLKPAATCTYAQAWLKRHPEYQR